MVVPPKPKRRGRRMYHGEPSDGGGNGGGAALSPLSILLLVFFVQLLDAALEVLKKKGMRSPEQLQLTKEIRQILKEAASLSTPSTFAQAAKLRRLAASKEKELLKKQEEQKNDSKSSLDLYAKALLILKVLIYAGLSWHFWGIPVAVVPQHLLQPLGSVLSWRAGDAISGKLMVGIIPWLILCSRVSKFLCQKLPKEYFGH